MVISMIKKKDLLEQVDIQVNADSTGQLFENCIFFYRMVI